MTCFEIAHSPDVQNMFATVIRDGRKYQRTVPTHPICKQLQQVYGEGGRPARGRPKKAKNDRELSDISSSNSETESELESVQITRTCTRSKTGKVRESSTKVTESEQDPIQISRTYTQKRKQTGPVHKGKQRRITRSWTQRVRNEIAPVKAQMHVLQRRRSKRSRK